MKLEWGKQLTDEQEKGLRELATALEKAEEPYWKRFQPPTSYLSRKAEKMVDELNFEIRTLKFVETGDKVYTVISKHYRLPFTAENIAYKEVSNFLAKKWEDWQRMNGKITDLPIGSVYAVSTESLPAELVETTEAMVIVDADADIVRRVESFDSIRPCWNCPYSPAGCHTPAEDEEDELLMGDVVNCERACASWKQAIENLLHGIVESADWCGGVYAIIDGVAYWCE